MAQHARIGATLTTGLTLTVALSLLAGACASSSSSSSRSSPAAKRATWAEFNGQGELMRPNDYRSWFFLGAPLTPNDLNDGAAAFPEFHHVYLDPQSYEHYKWTGEFREGAVIVKELVAVGSKAAPSGNGYFAGEIIGVEAMVKDSKRYPDRPSNWGFFRYTDEQAAAMGKRGTLKKTAPDVGANCIGCHAAGLHDRVFTQFYPALRAARGAQRNPEND